ncbi:unnamed protein product [Mytilus edulis]|uniref:Uncharacterized protein n=1 Tax=Mytilus edulis TaxID=6550 RepID=A0A8S3QU45_MYTED|nr:unnamed protein product [Mytilus edulis]
MPGQENVATEVVEEAEEMFENDHQQNIENAGQENVATEVVEEAEEIFENGSNEAESSSDYETDDEQYFYEQFEDWDGLSDEVQSNAKRFLDENYTVGELQLAFNKYSADKVDMIKSLEEKETEASELKMKLHDTRCFMGKQASVIHNYDQELRKSRECIDKMTVQYETVHDKNQQLLDANTHMLQTYMPLQRDCNLLLVKTKEKDQTIADLSKQINYQDDSIKSLTIQNKDQDKSNKSLKMENTKLQDKIVKQGEVNFDLMKDKKLLEEENKDMKVKYTDLKK